MARRRSRTPQPFKSAPATSPRQSVNRPAKRGKRFCWCTRRLADVEVRLVRQRKCRWAVEAVQELQAHPWLACWWRQNELHSAGHRRAEHGGKALCFTVRTPLSSTLVHGDARIPADGFRHPTSTRPLAVVEQHHGDCCGQCGE
jgi:hypothetical protein